MAGKETKHTIKTTADTSEADKKMTKFGKRMKEVTEGKSVKNVTLNYTINSTENVKRKVEVTEKHKGDSGKKTRQYTPGVRDKTHPNYYAHKFVKEYAMGYKPDIFGLPYGATIYDQVRKYKAYTRYQKRMEQKDVSDVRGQISRSRKEDTFEKKEHERQVKNRNKMALEMLKEAKRQRKLMEKQPKSLADIFGNLFKFWMRWRPGTGLYGGVQGMDVMNAATDLWQYFKKGGSTKGKATEEGGAPGAPPAKPATPSSGGTNASSSVPKPPPGSTTPPAGTAPTAATGGFAAIAAALGVTTGVLAAILVGVGIIAAILLITYKLVKKGIQAIKESKAMKFVKDVTDAPWVAAFNAVVYLLVKGFIEAVKGLKWFTKTLIWSLKQVPKLPKIIWGQLQTIWGGLTQPLKGVKIPMPKIGGGGAKPGLPGGGPSGKGSMSMSSSMRGITGSIDLSAIGKGIGDFFKSAGRWISKTSKGIWNTVSSGAKAGFELLSQAVSIGWTFISNIFTTVVRFLVGFFGDRWEDLKGIASTVWDTVSGIPGIITGAWDTIKGKASEIWDKVSGAVTKTISEGWDQLKTKATELWDKASGLIVKTVSDGWDNLKTTASTVWDFATGTIPTTISKGWEALKTKSGELWDSAKGTVISVITSGWDTIKTKADEFWNSATGTITTVVTGAWNGIKTAWDTGAYIWDTIKGWLKDISEFTWGTATSAWDNLKTKLVELKDNVIGGAEGLVEKFTKFKDVLVNIKDNVVDKISDAWEGIKEKGQMVIDFFSNLKTILAGFFEAIGVVWAKFKDVALGLWDAVKTILGGDILEGVKKARDAVTSVGDLFKDIGESTSSESKKSEPIVQNILLGAEAVKDAGLKFGKTVLEGANAFVEAIKTGAKASGGTYEDVVDKIWSNGEGV